MPMPSNIFSKSKKTSATTTSYTTSSSILNATTTSDNNQLNSSTGNLNKKTKTKSKHTYQSINKNLNQLFNHSAFASAPSSTQSVMMPSVASRLKKNIARTKEKILQGIGKTDRTNDESFDLYVENFDRQHSQASKLTKELHKYVNCLKETQKSSRLFYETLRDTYEPNWPGSNQFTEQIQLMELKWNDYLSKLINEVQSPLIAYLNEFPELKKKIEKRDNRLLDYDNARHTLESAQYKSSKKQNNTLNSSGLLGTATTSSSAGAMPTSSLTTSGGSSSTSSSTTDQLTKLTKLKIELEDKQQNYEEINQTLCMSLPVLYENRIKFYSSLFQTFFHTETIFHSDCVEVKSILDDLCESLSTKTAQQNPNPHKLFQQKQEQLRLLQQQKELEEEQNGIIKTISTDTNNYKEQEETMNNNDNCETTSNMLRLSKQRSSTDENQTGSLQSSSLKTSEYDNEPTKTSKAEFVPNTSEFDSQVIIKNDSSENFKNIEKEKSLNKKECSNINDENASRAYQSKMSNSILKNRTLYKVRATYPYEAKELDELSFIKDDIIDVVDGSESEKEDLDDGWLIGLHETTLKRGLFPENFTKRL